ncbi:hypothetical protein J2751_002685 [Halorubrum alkaliphilum]|uniref:Uncharacterized protein n=1 Tax=Halorubrum alkaliphilum TaxID=261290 RepID=A0A8T4GJ67_9EURY|nr:hypothetical protein [Halorubrum alkaliphilum]
MEPDTDVEGEVRPLDETALEQIRDEFTTLDGLVIEAGFDSLLDPTKLVVRLDDGIGGADSCRFDLRWYQTGYYNFHHTDEQDVNFRFDYHPKPDAPNKHFHAPPEALSERPQRSCITTIEPRLVTRAVHFLWRRAYEESSLTQLNEAENPP